MIRIFMPMSGNVGDTLAVLPVLSGIYKSTGHQISLVVRDKMKMFNGFRDFMMFQPCIVALRFESEINMDQTYQTLSLVDTFTKHPNRPWETVRLEEDFRNKYNLEFEVDDDFELQVPEIKFNDDRFLVGDRMLHPDMDQRRKFNVLEKSNKFPLDKCRFLDYNENMLTNAAYVKLTKKPIFTTFTGISTIADLLKKETVVLWGDDLKDWDNKPIEYSFNKHFYRNRKCRLEYLNNFNIEDY